MSDPGYRILSARYANAEGTAVVCRTIEAGDVAASVRDRPDLWKRIHDTVPIAPYVLRSARLGAIEPPTSPQSIGVPVLTIPGEDMAKALWPPQPPEEERREAVKSALMAALRNACTCTVDDLMRYDLALQARNQNMRAMGLLQIEAQVRGLLVGALADEIIAERQTHEEQMMRRHAALARLLAEVDSCPVDDLSALVSAGIAEIKGVA